MNRPARSTAVILSKLLTFTSVFLVFSSASFAQKFEIENKFHIKQDEKSIVFHVLDDDDSQLKKYKQDKDYYWFKSQKILITQGGSSGSLLNGAYESFYRNNQLAEKGEFKKGLKHGVWQFWNPNGILVHRENWSKGIRTGKQYYYSNQGIIQKTVIYKSNQTQVISRDTTIVKTRKTVLTTVNDSTGRLISQSRYSDYVLDGTQIVRDGNDSLVKTVYKKGIPVTPKVKKAKKGQTQAESPAAEKLTFKQKMGNFWNKLKFWKKFKKKDQPAEKKSRKEKAEKVKEPAPDKTEKKKRKA